jgi:uncharacterized membrane protein
MGAIFQSLGRTVLAGIVILAVIMAVAGTYTRFGEPAWWQFFMRWLHVMSGVMWIGLLWYFNFVQIPSMPKIPDEQKPAIGKVIAPASLFWFRWAAMATLVTGVIVAWLNGFLLQALSLQPGFRAIGVGVWLAIVMWFNVWFIIWPNQKKALGLVQVSPEEKTRAARMAMLTSRFNTMLSVPMLYLMVAQSHPGL